MKLTHKFAEMTPEKRPQDPHMDGTGLRIETLEHGGEYPDTNAPSHRLINAEGRCCICVSIVQNARWSMANGSCSMRRTTEHPAREGYVASTRRTDHTERTRHAAALTILSRYCA